MNQDTLLIDIPKYEVEYKEETYNYKTTFGKKNLKKVLYCASDNYCMYCYTRIKIDNNEYGHLEHAIEKAIAKDKLEKCVPNIGIACPTCNDKYKKIGEKIRQPEKGIVEKFITKAKCDGKTCKVPCEAYLNLKKAYLRKKEAQFLMQPLGVTSKDIGRKENRELRLQYDIEKVKYIPSKKEDYTEDEIEFIRHHIDMFHLNSAERKSTQMMQFLEDTIWHDGRYTKTDYNNQIVELFVKQVLKNKTPEECLEICEQLYTYAILKFNHPYNK